MASGGFQPNKQAKSEPKRRSNWQRSVSSDRDDAQSLNSLPNDIRINNWDLSDLRPINLGGDSKRRKKSKGNPEREREQSLSMESPPHDQKHHTPSSYPRTKLAPGTPTSQRVALENLKQHMTFSDMDDQVSTDGERNNERQMSQSRRRLHNTSFNRTDSETDTRVVRDRRSNRNNVEYASRDQGPDSNEIVARLMQIRDFMKQARSMLASMEKMGDRKKTEDVEKVRRLIRNLQEQEQGYRGLLQNTLVQDDDEDNDGDGDEAAGRQEDTPVKVEVKEDSDDDTSVDLEVRTENSETTENSQDSRPRIESKLGISGDDEKEECEEVEMSEPIRGAVRNRSENANSGRGSDLLENTLVQGQFTLPGVPVQESAEGVRTSTTVDVPSPGPQHQELLLILREKQQQLQSLMSRQEELNMQRRETEKKLLDAQARDNKARAALAAVSTGRQVVEQRLATQQALTLEAAAAMAGWEREDAEEEEGAVGEDGVLKSNIVGYPESDDDDNSNVREVETLPNELLELKRQLNFLRNEFSQVSEAPKNVESESQSVDDGRQQLQNKLHDLQSKKSRMDRLLQELQMLHSQPLENLRNNETLPQASNSQAAASNIPAPRQQQQQQQPPRPPQPKLPPQQPSLPANLQARMNDIATSAPSAVENAMETFAQLARQSRSDQGSDGGMDPATVLEVQEKLRHLKEVRGQLDQLRGLVQYYQGQKEDIEAGAADGDDQSSLPGFSDAGEHGALNSQAPGEVRGSQSSLQRKQQQQQQQQSQHQQLHELLRLQQQQLRQGDEGIAPTSSLHNMVQLLNLAGNDQGDEHSDEDNASVSPSESQWSHLGPWDDDPEIQEKVKKLKAAKEKLRQLQDLVAFVQQSPDAARALPENLGELAASVEGEAVSQATQTDEPNVSVSEGEVASDSHRMQQRDEEVEESLEDPRVELERLRKERAMLLEIQSQLKHIHNQVGRTTDDQRAEMQEREEHSDVGKSGQEQTPNAPVVTFASNDELYSKMRRQRILREELRSKKKELEAIMKKDRNKRQYSRNQDNQSDTVSLNTDTFGIPASVDATMATWGGSTVDNLENITEDEDGQERNDRVDGDEDDGYPSDGIVQVEEEEEENDSDNGTYTIEADARQRKSMRKGTTMGIGARPKTSRGRQTFPQPAYSDKNMKKSERKQNTRHTSRSQRNSNVRQENYRSAQEIIREDEDSKSKNNGEWFRLIEDRLTNLSGSVEALLRKSETESRQLSVSLSQENAPQGTSLISPMQEQMLQLQHQSMMLSFGQLVQSLTRQQGDMQTLQHQMQALQLQVQDYQQEHSFHAGIGVSQQLRQGISNPALNNSNYNLQATVPGTHPLPLNQQQMPSPFTQSNLNNTAPGGFPSRFPAASPGMSNIQQQMGLRLSSSNPSLGQDRGVAGGFGSGLGLSINTGSTSSLPHQGTAPGFVFNPLGQSTVNPTSFQGAQNEVSQAGSSASTMTRDFSQFVNTLQSTPPPQGSSYGQFSNLFGSSSQQQQQGAAGGFPFLPSHGRVDENEELDGESPVPRMSSYIMDGGKNKKRKYGSKVKKSESDPTSGLRMSTPKVEKSQGDVSQNPFMSQRWSTQTDPTSEYRNNTSVARFDGGGSYDGGAAFDAGSSYSSIQSIKDQYSKISGQQTQAKSTDTADDGNTLFDTLRDTIYTEVASLISQNENRPHFLLELFRDMRQIDSDLMRQRTLYSIQGLIGSNLKPNSGTSSSLPSWVKAKPNAADTPNSEQTPSESVTSEDDEDLKVIRLQEEITAAERSRLERQARNGPQRHFPFDYVESADNPSSLSTPTNCYEESPFFQDTLGETVIEFDSLKREEEARLQAARGRRNRQEATSLLEGGRRNQAQKWGEGGFLASEQLLKDMNRRRRSERKMKDVLEGAGVMSQGSQSSEVASSSAMDQASESSMSDMPYPRIDMKQLDRQIKDIMMQTIPVVKEHMEDVCSPQLLAYIKRLVLSLTSQMGNQEFARFFQRQLGSILEDTLQKYQGRKMRECGEDLLVEISDVLFNELAFFRLMQDLDDPNVAGKIRAAEWETQASMDKEENSSEYSADSSSEGQDDNDDDNNDAGNKKNEDGDNIESAGDKKTQRGFRITEAEQELLGRERDDEMANEIVHDAGEKDDDDTEQSYKIELAPSETKPFTRIGSDEDDDDGDEELSMDDPSETAVSRDAMLETNVQSQQFSAPSTTRPEAEGARGDGTEKQDLEKPISPRKGGFSPLVKSGGDGDGAENASSNNSPSTALNNNSQMNGTLNGDANNNNSDEELTVDDLPERLTVQSGTEGTPATASASNNNTPDLRRRYEEEQRALSGIDAVLASLEGAQELAGDGMDIVDPDLFLS